MMKDVKKDAESIAHALKNVENAMQLKDPLDILMAFSQAPLVKIDKLLLLLEKVHRDIKFVQGDVEKRKEKALHNLGSVGADRYDIQKTIILKNMEVVEGWEV